MKVLFIGGTGIISSACSILAIERGIDLYHLNRGQNKARPIKGLKNIKADIRNYEETKAAIASYSFDAVVQWIAFEPEHIENDIKLFQDKTKQYIFISSASIYQTPPQKLPITENTPLDNPIWEYSQNKIACEDTLRNAYNNLGFPYTIVRPSHTYDKTLIPIEGGYTAIDRMKKGLPVIIHGDGASIWTLTHHKDFAKGLVGLLGKKEALNEAYHITSNELLSWEMIFRTLAKELGVKPKLVYVPSNVIAAHSKRIGDSLLGDKTHSMIFDNSKIKALVPEFNASIPFAQGAKEIISWYEEDASRQMVDAELNKLMEQIIAGYTNTNKKKTDSE